MTTKQKKKKINKVWIVILLIVLLIGVNSLLNYLTDPTIQTYQVASNISTSKIDLKVNSTRTSTGDGEYDFAKPEYGHKWLIVKVTIKNVTDNILEITPYMFRLEEGSGIVIDHDANVATTDSLFDSSIAPGAQITREVIFTVDKDSMNNTLFYTYNAWDKPIKIKL